MNEAAEESAEARAAADALSRETVDAVLEAVEADDHDALVALLEPLHEADIADLLEQISRAERQALIGLWGVQLDGEVLAELEEGVRDEIVAELPDHILAAAVQDLETDDVVYLTEDMDEPQQERILRALDDADRAAVEASLKYERVHRRAADAARGGGGAGALDGGRRHRLHARRGMAAGELLRHRRRRSADAPGGDGGARAADGGGAQGAAQGADGRGLPHHRRRRRARRTWPILFNKYHLTSAPVVDADGRLVGVITIDDAMEALEEEAEEDIRLLAGVGDEEL